jgi:hypothetical protein
MKKNNPVGFLLKFIRTEQFAIIEGNYKENDIVNLNSTISFKLNSIDKVIGSFTEFTFEQNKCPFLIIQVSCNFKIDEDSWKGFLNESNSNIIIPKGFLAHLAMITVGTTRGVLFSKTENTIYNSFLIPLINVSEMIEEDAIFPI